MRFAAVSRRPAESFGSAGRVSTCALLGALLAAPNGASAQPAPPDEPPKPAAAPADVPKEKPAGADAEAKPEQQKPEQQKPEEPKRPGSDKDPGKGKGFLDHAKEFLSGFSFGTYGRIIAGGDLRGRPGRDQDIVARGSRLDEGNYVELELRRKDLWGKTGITTEIVATLAFAHPMFHYNGNFDASFAPRNLYLEARDLGVKGLALWAGSRMYRGDDIYLLDFWPLDNLNTLGGGTRLELRDGLTKIAIHGGLNQPDNPFYRQLSDRPLPAVAAVPGATKVEILSRQKFIGSARVENVFPVGATGGVKGVLYAEAHALPGGQREREPKVYEDLPADNGFVLGAQLGAFTGERSTHLNLFFRFARGLAAYGELGTPKQVAQNLTSGDAHEVLVAASGNGEIGPIAIQAAAYFRSFRSGSPALDFSDLDEGIFLVRPHVFFTEWLGLAAEASYQGQQRGVTYAPQGVLTGPFYASLWRFGVMPIVTPAGMGSYSRPQFRLIYALTLRDAGARLLYPEDDVQGLRDVDHFFGFGVEWWLNQSWQYGQSAIGGKR